MRNLFYIWNFISLFFWGFSSLSLGQITGENLLALNSGYVNEVQRTFRIVEPTKLSEYSDITFYLRMPKLWNGQEAQPKDFFGKPNPAVRGVLAIGTWSSEAEEVLKNVKDKGGRFPHLVKFADENNLAMLTWTNFKGYKTGISGDEMDEERYESYDRQFDDRAREWENGYKRICNKFSLPEGNLLYYGLSGGGQMGHRLALRKPQYFAGVHIHVNSSYDVPKPGAEKILWLVSTGTREYGYPAGQRFYRQALELGFHMIFKAQENLGHSSSPEINKLGVEFFEYCLKFIPDPTDDNWQQPPIDKFYLMRHPIYVGDYFNQEAFHVDWAEKYIEPQFMVALPTKDIAQAWGTVWE